MACSIDPELVKSTMAGMLGGLSEAKDVTPEVAEIVAAKKGDCESKSGKTFATFEPKKFVQQVVAGMIYKVKVSLSHSHDVRRHAHPPRFVCADTCLSSDRNLPTPRFSWMARRTST